MKSMSFTVFSYNATVLLVQPNQPNPWMDPTHVYLWSINATRGGSSVYIVPSTINFASLNVFRNSIEKIDLSSFFLVCRPNIFYVCDRICTHAVTVFIERF